jgi:hypothetical protein
MNALAITALTDFLLACEIFFLAGRASRAPKSRFSAAWYFSGALLLLAVAAMLGGIDHGFFEPANVPRYLIQRTDWLVLGGVTFCLLLTTAKQFFETGVQRIFAVVAVVQFGVFAGAALLVDDFRVVIVNYAPVMLLLLAMNFIRLRNGTGSGKMAAGILILFAASGIQAAGVDVFSPLDRNGLYHLVSMVGAAFLYAGGARLRTK